MRIDGYDVKKISKDSVIYPNRLKEISDAPDVLYCVGNTALLNEKSVAVVGSRKFTIYGKYVSQMIGKTLAESGLVVASGLAYGIDGFAHEGALEVDGKCIGVLGSGFLKMTPRKNISLMNKIVESGGLIISEYEPEFPAQKWTYPRRNRIISGISDAICVVEANYNSGALITANFALEQGRAVYAVPGNINSQFSMGSNLLIRDGAIPLVVIDDIVRDLGLEVSDKSCEHVNLGEDELEIMNIVKLYNGISADDLAIKLNKRPQTVNSILTILEIKGYVRSNCGKYHMVS